MLYGLTVTAILHDTAHTLRRRVRETIELGASPDGIKEMVALDLLAAVARIKNLPFPCGAAYGAPLVRRVCERPRGHSGEHDGNL